MTYDEVNDDYGLARIPYRVIACVAVYGRVPLLEHTIRRLYQKNGCYKVICVGDLKEDKALCESLGAVWVHYSNRFLGDKWNHAFMKAKEYNPDAVLFVGSSDWVCDSWIPLMQPYVEEYGFAGTAGCYLADLGKKIRLVHWKGYRGYRAERADETIGIGRMLSRRLLDAIHWQPFNPVLKASLDRSMKDNAKKKGFVDFMVSDDRLKSLSISTHLWPNKHVFEMHWDETHKRHYIPSEKLKPEPFISYHFPELNTLFESLPKPIIHETEPSGRTDAENPTPANANGVPQMPIHIGHSENRRDAM